jgi:hypothetical protein
MKYMGMADGVCDEQEVRECPAKRETGGHRDVVFGVYLEQ